MAGAMLVSLKKAYVAKMRHFELPSDLVDLERGVVVRTPDEWWGEASKAYYVVKKAHVLDDELVVTVGLKLSKGSPTRILALLDFYCVVENGENNLYFTARGARNEELSSEKKRALKALRAQHAADHVSSFYNATTGQLVDMGHFGYFGHS